MYTSILVLVTLTLQRSLLLTLIPVVELFAESWISFDSALGIALQLVLIVFSVPVSVRVWIRGVEITGVVGVVHWVYSFVVLVTALVLVLGIGFFDDRSNWCLATITVSVVGRVVVLLVRWVSSLEATYGAADVDLVVWPLPVSAASAVWVLVLALALHVGVRVYHLDAVQSVRQR